MSRLRIVVSGMIAGDPFQGGATWAVLQYVLGLRALGHDVFLIEPVASDSLRPGGTPLLQTDNARYFRDVVMMFGLADRAALLQAGHRATVGLPYEVLDDLCRSADLLFNISGMLSDQRLTDSIPRRLYLDLDPAFNQLWKAVDGIDVGFEGHTHFASIGTAIGTPECDIPTCGYDWIPTFQPIVLSEWPVTQVSAGAAWTTVANWRGYGSIEHAGVQYGQKAHSMRALLAIPRRVPGERFVLALSIHPDETSDLDALAAHGWQLVDPRAAAGGPAEYRRFIQASKAEFGVAKSGYVRSRCGWFSDRSVCYLASGRPVLAQDTGLTGILPIGSGLLTFSTEDEAVFGIETINAAYDAHASAARDIAVEYFDSTRVLTKLLEAVAS
jgi:hypothetical protein